MTLSAVDQLAIVEVITRADEEASRAAAAITQELRRADGSWAHYQAHRRAGGGAALTGPGLQLTAGPGTSWCAGPALPPCRPVSR